MVKKLMRPSSSGISTVRPIFPEFESIGAPLVGSPAASGTDGLFPDENVPFLESGVLGIGVGRENRARNA